MGIVQVVGEMTVGVVQSGPLVEIVTAVDVPLTLTATDFVDGETYIGLRLDALEPLCRGMIRMNVAFARLPAGWVPPTGVFRLGSAEVPWPEQPALITHTNGAVNARRRRNMFVVWAKKRAFLGNTCPYQSPRREVMSAPDEPQVECREHQDDSNIHYESFPESAPEERDVNTDYDGYHCQHVERDNYWSAHFSQLNARVVDGAE